MFYEQQYYEERVTKSYVIPDDPLFPYQWNLVSPLAIFCTKGAAVLQLNTGRVYGEDYTEDLNVEPAWLQGLTGCNVTVAVVDDGN